MSKADEKAAREQRLATKLRENLKRRKGQARASLHAKCLVVDEQQVLLTSANFTEAAQARNIEVGLLVQSGNLAKEVTGFYEALVRKGHLRQVRFWEEGVA